jgi:hypothetical protein
MNSIKKLKIRPTDTTNDNLLSNLKNSLIYINQNEIMQIKNHLNNYRIIHQVKSLEWSDEISSFANNWANYLIINNLFRHSGNKMYGENLAYLSGYGTDIITLLKFCIDTWYREARHYNFKNAKFSEKTQHFTTLVWKKCSHFGMGIAINTHGEAIVVYCCSPRSNIVGKFSRNVIPFIERVTAIEDKHEDNKSEKQISQLVDVQLTKDDSVIHPTVVEPVDDKSDKLVDAIESKKIIEPNKSEKIEIQSDILPTVESIIVSTNVSEKPINISEHLIIENENLNTYAKCDSESEQESDFEIKLENSNYFTKKEVTDYLIKIKNMILMGGNSFYIISQLNYLINKINK